MYQNHARLPLFIGEEVFHAMNRKKKWEINDIKVARVTKVARFTTHTVKDNGWIKSEKLQEFLGKWWPNLFIKRQMHIGCGMHARSFYLKVSTNSSNWALINSKEIPTPKKYLQSKWRIVKP